MACAGNWQSRGGGRGQGSRDANRYRQSSRGGNDNPSYSGGHEGKRRDDSRDRGPGGRAPEGRKGGGRDHDQRPRRRDWDRERSRSRTPENHENRRSRDDRDGHDQQDGKHQTSVELSSPCIWIGGLPKDITEREIERVCSRQGPVQNITIKHSVRDTFVFVQYGNIEHARNAIRTMDQANAFGAGIIKVAPATRKGQPRESSGGPDHHAKDPPQDGPRRDSGQARYQKDTRSDPDQGRYRSRQDSGHDDYQKDGGSRPYRHNSGSGTYHKDDWNDRNQKDSWHGQRKDNGQDRHPRRSRSPQVPDKGKGGGGGPTQDSVRVSIRHLPRDMEADELHDIATKYGRVLEYDIWREGSSKRGWVEFGTRREANRAIDELDNRRMEDWNLCLEAYIDCMR